MGNIILHAFNWKYKEVESKAEEIKRLGYSGVLISPPAFSEGDEWYLRYQPIDYRIIHSPLGNLQNLKDMIHALKQNGLNVFVDIVFNHMAYRPDENLNFPGDNILARYQSDTEFKKNKLFGNLNENLFSSKDFNPKNCIDSSDYNDANKIKDVHEDRICDNRVAGGLPDLNHHSSQVVEAQRQYLVALKNLGVNGFRIDAAKHMPVEHIQKVFTADIVSDLLVFGEIIPAEHGQFLKDFLQGVNFSAYDFKLFYSLHDAFRPEESFEKLVDSEDLDTFRSLTFVITHDIPNNESMRGFIFDAEDPNRTDENIAYAYILGRDGGVPLVYSDKGEKDDLYTNYWKEAYKNPLIVKMIAFHNALFGKKMEILSAGKCHLIFNREGMGILVLNKCSEDLMIQTQTENLQGVFKNVINDHFINIENDHFMFKLPPKSFQLYLKEPIA